MVLGQRRTLTTRSTSSSTSSYVAAKNEDDGRGNVNVNTNSNRTIPFGGKIMSKLHSKNKKVSKCKPVLLMVLLMIPILFVLVQTASMMGFHQMDLLGQLQAIRLPSFSLSMSYVSKEEIYESLLNDKSETLLCTIPRFRVDDKLAKGLGTRVGPVLLEGWEIDPNDWTKKELMDRVGEYPQYVKGLTVQPLTMNVNVNKESKGDNNNNNNKLCKLKGKDIADLLPEQDLLFFTNNQENAPFMKDLRTSNSKSKSNSDTYTVPSVVKHIRGFEVFSALGTDKYHSMHAHGESWLGQVSGRRVWWFLPPDTFPKPERVDACGYMTGKYKPPANAKTCTQNPGEIVWFPKDWLHATCALDEWTVGIGAQQGRTIRQKFQKLKPNEFAKLETNQNDPNYNYNRHKEETIKACLPTSTTSTTTISADASQKEEPKNEKEWQWFNGDLNAYYNSLETQIHDRNPENIASYAVHRWMGKKRSTEEHYELVDRAISNHHTSQQKVTTQTTTTKSLKVFDGGCGLGSALMFFEKRHPNWELTGHTISEEQQRFIETKLPKHSFTVNLRSYDDIDDGNADVDNKIRYDVIYSIEALIHSTNVEKTMREWAEHLAPGGIIVIIDDYVSEGADKTADDMQNFSKSWLANTLITPTEFEKLANTLDLKLVENRDLLAEYEIVKINYRNHKPVIKPVADRNHQGWMGSKWRQRLTVEGKLAYDMIVLKKNDDNGNDGISSQVQTFDTDTDNNVNTANEIHCEAVPSTKDGPRAEFTEITPQLMSGKGANGGQTMACISGWYCCNKGIEWYDNLDTHRTHDTAFLKLDRNLFGHYVDVFTKHLNEYYPNYPASFGGGRFLDIGGTGSTASGMQKVTSKFQHFAGPLEYWKLDSDQAAKNMERTLFCDIDDCPAADTCGFDVTFSHTVLEHAKRPWKSFDTIARITKKGGLTMHLVPWSYQYHATPDDNYRFSHKALITLLEDRGFDVLDVGYDICTKRDHKKTSVDEHYDEIWLTYVVGRKR